MKEKDVWTMQVDPRDNVRIALVDLPASERIWDGAGEFPLRAAVPAEHKLATFDLAPGDRIVMYGVEVGRATRSIHRGEAITPGNVAHSQELIREMGIRPAWEKPDTAKWLGRTFAGYHRADGRVGTANYWIVVPLVFCENRSVRVLEEALRGLAGPPPFARGLQVAEGLLAAYRQGGDPEAFLEERPARCSPPREPVGLRPCSRTWPAPRS